MKRSLAIGSAMLILMAAGCASTPRGTLVETSRPLDLAIDGAGYFIIDTGHKSFLFTRRGDFSLDTNRYLINRDGYHVAPTIVIPDGATDIRVSIDGRVTALANGRVVPAGQLRLATFPSPERLDRDGDYAVPTGASGEPTTHAPGSGGAGTIRQSMLEN